MELTEKPLCPTENTTITEVSDTESTPELIPSMDDFKEEIQNSFHKYEQDDIVNGTVIGISESEVILDLGCYAEGIIKLEELSNDPRFSIKSDISIGDQISAVVLREDREGNILLSKKQAEDILSWDWLKKEMQDRTSHKVKVAEAVKGGVVTYLHGVRAFIPSSQLTLTYVDDPSSFCGKELDVIIITVNEDDKKLVLSAKEVERDLAQAERVRHVNRLVPGTITTGSVEKIMPFGAFISIGTGLSGLVHISQICDKRIKSPSEVLKEGDIVKVKLLEVKDGKISLSIKAAAEEEPDPDELEEAPLEYSTGESATTGLGALLAGFKFE